jgi:hypothetical protein
VPAPVPPEIAALEGLETRCDLMDADIDKVREFIVAHIV